MTNARTCDVRKPAIPDAKPQQTIRVHPFYGSYIGGDVHKFLAELCANHPGAEIISVVAAGEERNVLVFYRVPPVSATK